MALFRYKALSTTGESLDGQMEAANTDEVIVRLQDQGYLPVEARPADEGGGISLFARGAKKELDADQIADRLVRAGDAAHMSDARIDGDFVAFEFQMERLYGLGRHGHR